MMSADIVIVYGPFKVYTNDNIACSLSIDPLVKA